MAQPLQELASLGDLFFVLAVTLLVVSWATVGLRIWVRYGITKAPGWDDAAIVFTLCLFTCYVAFILVLITTARGMQAFTFVQVNQTLLVRTHTVFCLDKFADWIFIVGTTRRGFLYPHDDIPQDFPRSLLPAPAYQTMATLSFPRDSCHFGVVRSVLFPSHRLRLREPFEQFHCIAELRI